MSANDNQVAGTHYKLDSKGEQHWDRVYRLYGRGYFVGCATKYLERYHLKNGKQDLEKAIHFIEKLMELEYGEKLMELEYGEKTINVKTTDHYFKIPDPPYIPDPSTPKSSTRIIEYLPGNMYRMLCENCKTKYTTSDMGPHKCEK